MKQQVLVNQAQALMDNDNFEQAYEMLKKGYEAENNNADLVEKLALAAKTLGKEEESIEYWEKLVELSPENFMAYNELQDLYFNTDKHKYYLTRAKIKVFQGNMGQAITDYKKAIDSTTDENDIINTRLLLAKAFEFVKKEGNAIDEYFKILDHKEDLAVFYKLADLYNETGDPHSAINVLDRAIEAYPDNTEIKEFMAKLLINTNQLDTALKFVQSDLNKVKIYLMLDDNEKAYEILKNSDHSDAQYNLLMAEYYFNKKDFAACKGEIEAFKTKEPNSPLVYQMSALIDEEQDNMAHAHYNWGRYYLMKEDRAMAQNEFLIAHNIDPKNLDVINAIVKIYEANGETHALLEFYEKILEIDPKNEAALENLAKFYKDMCEFSNAINYYEKLYEQNNKNYKILKDLAYCYEKSKNNYLAKEYYNKYLAKAPLTPENEALKAKINKMSEETMQEDDGFLNKLFSFFSK
ncbi:MAG: tetratricopeptide repeat protein [Candidatus Gastranaerophilales bacterium]|nr:tetratricopeptide repeat protein [Candidatus Gastranaerophilales bacterium]